MRRWEKGSRKKRRVNLHYMVMSIFVSAQWHGIASYNNGEKWQHTKEKHNRRKKQVREKVISRDRDSYHRQRKRMAVGEWTKKKERSPKNIQRPTLSLGDPSSPTATKFGKREVDDELNFHIEETERINRKQYYHAPKSMHNSRVQWLMIDMLNFRTHCDTGHSERDLDNCKIREMRDIHANAREHQRPAER